MLDGFSPALAQIAGKNNLALRRQELDAELDEALERMGQELKGKLRRRLEDWEDAH